jgi:HAD superfamily hydrolase (TIGR01509 family)
VKVEHAIFDLGGVVCQFTPARRLERLAAATGLTPERITCAIWTSGLDSRAEMGEFTPAETEAEVIATLDYLLDAERLRECWAAAFNPDEEVLGLLERLPWRTALFTNNGPLVSGCLNYELADVAAAVDHVVCSWQIKAVKPSTEAFTRMFAAIGADPSAVLYVDDSSANTSAAAALGCHGAYVHVRSRAGPSGGEVDVNRSTVERLRTARPTERPPEKAR